MTALLAPWVVATVVAGGGIGLLIGSFLNVVVYRVPNGLSVSSPPSACPGCHSQIKAYDNVPVLSWLLLGGKCRSCREPISSRYPLVELATAAFFVVVAVSFVPHGLLSLSALQLVSRLLTLVAFLYLAAVSVALGLIDVDVHRLPDRIVLPSYIVGAAVLGASHIVVGDWGGLVRTFAGMAVLFVGYGLMAFAYPKGMGLGDVKLAGVLGLYLGSLGWGSFAVGAFAAFFVGGVFSLVLLVSGRVSRKGGIPFGPWMLAGAWIGILFGQLVWHSYLSLLGLA